MGKKAMFPLGWKRLRGFLRNLGKLRKRAKTTDAQLIPITGDVIVSSPKLEEAEGSGRIENLDENLKKRIKHLGEAINQSLSESEPIADAIADIKAAGYDIFLVLEATIGFSQQGEESGKPAMVTASMNASEPEFRVTAQDMKFLKSLRIRLDE
jgi:hypothetical protein